MTSAIEFRNVIFGNGNTNVGPAVRLLDLLQTQIHSYKYKCVYISRKKDSYFVMFMKGTAEMQSIKNTIKIQICYFFTPDYHLNCVWGT